MLGAEVTSPTDDFFDFGGGSLTAAQVVGRLRERYPEVAVGDVYANPTVAALAAALEELGGTVVASDRRVLADPAARPRPDSWRRWCPLRALAALRWISWLVLGSDRRRAVAGPGLAADVPLVAGPARPPSS